jgi:DNA end-binding protein Ku
MPRSIWNGAVAFGLVVVPIKVYSATESKTVRFHEVHLKDGGRIEHRRVCPNDGEQVGYDDIVKGVEVAEGEWVELTDEEIEAAVGVRSKVVDIEDFVPAQDIDPDYYERTYYVGAGEMGDDAYALLRAALARTERAAIGRWVFHDRLRTVVIRTLGDVLAMHTLRFAAELVDPRDFELPRVRRGAREREVEMAVALVEALHARFKPEAYQDEYRRAVLELVEKKAAGEPIEPPRDDEPEPSGDLLGALEASLRRPKAEA